MDLFLALPDKREALLFAIRGSQKGVCSIGPGPAGRIRPSARLLFCPSAHQARGRVNRGVCCAPADESTLLQSTREDTAKDRSAGRRMERTASCRAWAAFLRPPERPLLYSKRCFSCQAVDDLSISEEECQKCPNRVYRVYPNWGTASCEIPCPPDKPLQRWDGACFSCDEPDVILLKTHCNLEDDCEFCPNRTILYDIGGNVPSVPNCPPDKPLMDNRGFCFPCDTPVAVGVRWNTSLCKRFCPNERHLFLEDCVLNK